MSNLMFMHNEFFFQTSRSTSSVTKISFSHSSSDRDYQIFLHMNVFVTSPRRCDILFFYMQKNPTLNCVNKEVFETRDML
jgi:hypothetical protein